MLLEKARTRVTSAQVTSSGVVIRKTINIHNLPAIHPTTVKPVVLSAYEAVNLADERKKKKVAKTMLGNIAKETLESEPDRPMSARSGVTAMTGGGRSIAMTTMTGKSNVNQNKNYTLEHDRALIKLMEKQSKMIDFIKFDSALARDQEIDVGRPSTLGDV